MGHLFVDYPETHSHRGSCVRCGRLEDAHEAPAPAQPAHEGRVEELHVVQAGCGCGWEGRMYSPANRGRAEAELVLHRQAHA